MLRMRHVDQFAREPSVELRLTWLGGCQRAVDLSGDLAVLASEGAVSLQMTRLQEDLEQKDLAGGVAVGAGHETRLAQKRDRTRPTETRWAQAGLFRGLDETQDRRLCI
jgi:hypothetical protein